MRKGDDLAKASPEDTVRAVLERMTQARTGAAIIVAGDGALAGIFTQGDFMRAAQKEGDVLPRPVREFMTVGPVSINSEKLAAEVLAVLGQNRIDDLVVVGADGKPVGLVDSQDLSRLKLV